MRTLWSILVKKIYILAKKRAILTLFIPYIPHSIPKVIHNSVNLAKFIHIFTLFGYYTLRTIQKI